MIDLAQKKQFNVIMEGKSELNSRFYNLTLKLLRLEIPNNIGIINDNVNKFLIYAQTNNLGDFKRIERKKSIEKIVSNLTYCNGIVIPSHKYYPQILEIPRSLYLRDGRIFVEQNNLNDSAYLEIIKKHYPTFWELFKDKNASEHYRKRLEQLFS